MTLIVQFAGCVVVIVVAGTILTRAADRIAELTGLGRLLVGSVFLAAATSFPELSIDISAIRLGLPDLAIGDLVGSSLFNLLVLGIVDLSLRSRGPLLARVSAAHSLSAGLTIALTATLAVGILLAERDIALSFRGVGITGVLILLGYGLGFRMIYFDQLMARQASQFEATRVEGSLTRALLHYVAAAAAIYWVAPYVAHSAGELARISGLGQTFIGSTLVAMSSSLPELISSLVAVRMGSHDLAIGNVFGSNAFNMCLLLPLDLFHEGPILQFVSATHVVTCLFVIIITAIIIMGQLYHVERRIFLFEPDASLVILLAFVALAVLYAMEAT